MPQNIHNKSVPDEVLSDGCRALRQWRDGASMHNVRLPERHRELLINVLMTYFRNRGAIEWSIDHLSRRGKVNPSIRDILRIGFTQILYMDGIPPAAATDACVRFARRQTGRKPAGFVNALLRRLVRTGRKQWLGMVEENASPDVQLNLAPALFERWRKRFSMEELGRLSEVLTRPAPVIVRERQNVSPHTAEAPRGCLEPIPAPDWMPDAVLYRCSNPGEFFRSAAFESGRFYIQDPSTLMAPAMLSLRAGETAADLCAAPGGKSVLLDELVNGNSIILAADRSLDRLRKLADNISVCRSVFCAVNDASKPGLRRESLDAVLLDVPCSNTGVIRRRPDAQWRFSEEALTDVVQLQREILAGAAPLLRRNGRLVYSTCSLEPEENSEQVKRFCAENRSFSIAKEKLLLPSEHHDGAYAALLTR